MDASTGAVDTGMSAIAHEIWDSKYRAKNFDGTPIDHTLADTFGRVANAVAMPEPEDKREFYKQEFERRLITRQFLPAGRIMAGAGSGNDVTLFNCYCMGTIEDSLSGIYKALHESAMTLRQGGGIGMDFSTLRPKGAEIQRLRAPSSGPLSFMDSWDVMCGAIMSAGARRGAMMGTMRCDHPDIEAFIDAKRDARRFRNFNLSVLVTDKFMAAVKANHSWTLQFAGKVYATMDARALWSRIMESTYESAEPGVIFIDRINERNNLRGIELISTTNPCGEQPLPPYGACLLGSLNLTAFILHPFSDAAQVDWQALSATTKLAVRFLDNVIDISNYPLAVQEQEAKAKRRMGLGVTGLADALVMLNKVYGSRAAAHVAARIMAHIEYCAYASSIDLARERGPFPAFDVRNYGLEGTHAYALMDRNPALAKAYAEAGIRNGLLTSIAPTGTISLFAGNVSSGIEPIYALEAERRILQPDGTRQPFTVVDYAVNLWRSRNREPTDKLPDTFVTASTLTPEEHLIMQEAVQMHVDSAISKTINCPENISFEAFKSVYQLAYDMGLKGCTTYRPNPITGAVLVASPVSSPQLDGGLTKASVVVPGRVEARDTPLPQRHHTLPGQTYKIKLPDTPAVYVTINDLVGEDSRRPFEIFINSRSMENFQWTIALTRMISAVFRRGGDVAFVAEELQAVFDPKGGFWQEGAYVPSLVAAIGKVVQGHLEGLALASMPKEAIVQVISDLQPVRPPGLKVCPQCSRPSLISQDGCLSCPDCGYTKCA